MLAHNIVNNFDGIRKAEVDSGNVERCRVVPSDLKKQKFRRSKIVNKLTNISDPGTEDNREIIKTRIFMFKSLAEETAFTRSAHSRYEKER